MTVDPAEVAAGRITEEQIAVVFAGLAPAVAQFTSLDLRPSSGTVTVATMTGWAARMSQWAAARGEPVESYHVNATAAVSTPRASLGVPPSEFEAFTVGSDGSLAVAVPPSSLSSLGPAAGSAGRAAGPATVECGASRIPGRRPGAASNRRVGRQATP